MTRADKWKKRDATDRYWAFCDEARLAATGVPGKHITEDIFGIYVFAHCSLPESWSEKKKLAFHARLCQSQSDTDNILKGVMDALFEQDKKICIAQCIKFWCEEGTEPHIDVFLLSLPPTEPRSVDAKE